MADNAIKVTLDGYSVSKFTEAIIHNITERGEEDLRGMVYRKVEQAISETLHEMVVETLDQRLTEIVNDALEKGVIVSEDWQDEVERKPISDLVREEAEKWLKKPDDHYHGGRKMPRIQKLCEEIVERELRRETEKMLKGIKDDAVKKAQESIAKVVAERLFNGKSVDALPL